MCVHDGVIFLKIDNFLVCIAPLPMTRGCVLNVVEVAAWAESNFRVYVNCFLRKPMASQMGGHRSGAENGEDVIEVDERERIDYPLGCCWKCELFVHFLGLNAHVT